MADYYDQELPMQQIAADTADAYTSDTLGTRLTDAATKGLFSAAVSGTMSIANTFTDSDNQSQVEDVLNNLGLDATADYYTENKQAIDTVGFVASSMATYGAGTMLLKAARYGNVLGPLSRGLRMLPDGNKNALRLAVEELAAPGGSMVSKVRSSTYQRLAWAIGDNVLTAAAGETATLALMHDSPFLEGYSASDFIFNAGVFGAVGGGIEFVIGRGIVRKAQSTVDLAALEFARMGKADMLGLKKQNEITVLADELTNLKTEFGSTPFQYSYAGEKNALQLNTAELFKQTRDRAMQNGLEKLSLKMNELAGGNVNVGQAYQQRIADVLARMGDSPQAKDRARDEIQGMMLPIGKLTSVNSVETLAEDGAAIYLRMGNKVEEGKFFDTSHSVGSTFKRPYKLADDVKQEDVVLGTHSQYPDKTTAFNDGVDVWYSKSGVPVVNPNSTRLISQVDGMTAKTGVVHIESGTHDFSPVYTIADDIENMSKDVRLTKTGDSISIAGKEYPQAKTLAMPLDQDTRAASTRYVWASQLSEKEIGKLGTIDAQDLPLMDRLAELNPEKFSPDLKFTLVDGSEIKYVDIPDFQRFRQQQKLSWLQRFHEEIGKGDTRELAVHLNTTQAWVERALSRLFVHGSELDSGILRTIKASEPRSVGVLFSNQAQFFRGTNSLGEKIKGALIKLVGDGGLDAQGLAKAMGITLTHTAADAKAAGVSLTAPKGRNAFMRGDVNLAAQAARPIAAHVDIPMSSDIKQLTGLVETQIIAHELGHALDYLLSDHAFAVVAGRIQDMRLPELTALREEMWATSKSFRPKQWMTQPDYVKKAEELFADNFATWMTKPEKRVDMPLFAELYAEKLEPYEQFIRQRVWQRTNGPAFAADAALAHEYELRMRTQLAQNAVRAALPDFAERLIPVDPNLAKQIDTLGAGASTLTASNAGYGQQLKQWAQYTGKLVNEWRGKLQNNTAIELRSLAQTISDNKEAGAELGVLMNAVRRTDGKFFRVVTALDNSGNPLERPLTKFVSEDVKKLLDADPGLDVYSAIAKAESQGKYAELPVKSDAVRSFLIKHSDLNDARQEKLGLLYNSVGLGNKRAANQLYIPPIDTSRYSHIAFVRQKEGIGSSGEVAMITAKDADQLRALMSRVPAGYEAFDKTNLENFFRAKGSYDYSHFITDTRVSSEMRKRGVLGDFFPETRPDAVVTDFVSFHNRQDEMLVRKSVEVQYADLISQLKYLSDDFTRADKSVARGKLAVFQQKIADPYGDYIKTALDISKRQEFPLLDAVNDFVDNIGRKAGSAYEQAIRTAKASDTMVDWQRANQIMRDYGMTAPFDSMEQYLKANEALPPNLIAQFIYKANSTMATLGLRLDFANSLVNILSTPIMLGMEHASIKRLASSDPELAGKLAELHSVRVPGTQDTVPSFSKLMFSAVNNYFKDDGTLMNRYRSVAGIGDILDHHKMMLDDLAYKHWEPGSQMMQRLDSAVETASKYTGNQFAEKFTRFVSADVMRQQTEILVKAGKMSLQEADAYISTFVNRVQGNYVASQRPIIFQGTAGRAVSLFQTYMFNVAQQLFRHVEDRNTKALMTFGFLQSSIYGLNGLPYFDAVNAHLIGNSSANPEHKDLVSSAVSGSDDIGKWLMYGTASAFPLFDGQGPALYSRGDLNPRTMVGLPTSFTDIPALAGSIKLVNSVKQFASVVSNGGNFSDGMLLALEHQGLSRPLAGFAQVVSGRATTSKGDLIAANNDLALTASLSQLHPRNSLLDAATRIAGAKPLDTAVAMDTIWRNKQYDLEDRERISNLGAAVKTKLYNNKVPTDEEYNDFLSRYVSSGGTQRTFAREMQRWMQNANTSVINQMAEKSGSRTGQRLQELMGGQPLQDYSGSGQSPPDLAPPAE
jgi:hypothetical protein